MKAYIREYDLIVGATYKGEGRNATHGCWTGDAFLVQRYKFGQWFEDTELHWDADRRYGTFKPFELITYPDTFVGACCRLRDACRELRAAIKDAAVADWQKIKEWFE